ncbi:MAG: hypothetical protein NUV80_06385 [Candidatus Berkelbacteria bacterium]|nr:hypothetical protein [Candidatus Berkelbacteria bacterium]
MLPAIDKINKVKELQAAMLKMPQLELPTFHYFADGLYARVVKRPAGTLIVGKIHKKEHLYIVTKGKVRVASDTGSVIYEAGDVIISKPGTKRAVLALEDSICMTVHRCEETDLEKIEEELVENEEQSLFGPGNKLKVLSCHS